MHSTIQSDNGSHFTAAIIQEWARGEGIDWIFHTPYYPQANGIVERINGLIKRFARVHASNWDLRLSEAVYTVNNRWGENGNTKVKAFCPTGDLISKKPHEVGKFPTQLHSGQPVMVKLPQIGVVPLILTNQRGLYAWEAKDSSNRIHRISSRWIIPDF